MSEETYNLLLEYYLACRTIMESQNVDEVIKAETRQAELEIELAQLIP